MGTFNKETFDKLKDTLTETAQDVKDRAIQMRDVVIETANDARDRAIEVRDAVLESTKDTREKAMGIADELLTTGPRLKEKVMGELDVLQLLKKDHEMVSSLFEQIDACDDNADREGLFAQLKYELSTHAMVEEELFYPALQRDGRGQAAKGTNDANEREELVHEAYQEHNVVRQLLSELAAMPISRPEWKAKLTVLKENVEHHVQEEENELFTIARDVLDKDQLIKMGARIEQEKVALADAGKPGESDEPQVLSDDIAMKPAGQKGGKSTSKGKRSGSTNSHRSHRSH